jgi:ParB family transcriptional regulator, chromosome partitioning protein
MKASEYGVRAIGVKSLSTEKLRANPHNPRTLFDREDMHVLRESIERVGILVPLTVYREKSTGSYVILDGQRRWMCAQEVGLKDVPVNVIAEPTLVQNIVTMFQIHKLRKDWELMPTALKLELLMRELGETKEKRLAELTGLDEAVVVRCKKLCTTSGIRT